MLNQTLLEKIGISSEDIPKILEQNAIYSEKIKPLATEYAKTLGHRPFLPYANEEETIKAYERRRQYVDDAIAIDPDNTYMLQLLAWLHLIPYLKERYDELGIDESIFISTMKDISYKVEECKVVNGVCGVFVDFFFLNFDLKLFELGRLQFHVNKFPAQEYTYGDYVIKKGDTVYSCHIPSSGKLTPELCMDSLHRAYEFFKSDLKGTVLPILCQSWLLYEPYVEQVFPEGSNLKKFARMFDVYTCSGAEFTECWRIFGKRYEGTTEGLPSDTTLRRNFIEYIQKGGTFGNGHGVLLYDGEKREIMNR